MSERERICLVIPYYEAGDDLTTTLGSVRLRADDLIVVVDDGSRRLPARDCSAASTAATPAGRTGSTSSDATWRSTRR